MNWEKIEESAITENKTEQTPCSELGSEPLKNVRQELFVQELIQKGAHHGNIISAFLAAGFKAKNNDTAVSASGRLLRNVTLRTRLTWLQKQIADGLNTAKIASKQELAEYYTRLLRTTVADFLEYDKDGERYFSIKDGTLGKEAIKKIKCRTIRDQAGNIKDEKQIEEIELESRLAAGRELANLMGYNTAVADQMPTSLKEFLDGIAKDCMKLPKDSEDLPPSPFKEVRLKIAQGGTDTSSTED